MFRTKDFTIPVSPQSNKNPNVEVALANTRFWKGHVSSLFVKLHVLNKSLCYVRGECDDRRVRVRYIIVMLDFPNGNTYPCIQYRDAINECIGADDAGNLYASETKVMLERAAVIALAALSGADDAHS